MNKSSGFSGARVRGALAGLVLAGASFVSAADDGRGSPYLALGDSVAFGYITQDGYAYVNPGNFLGYPEWLGVGLRMKVHNSACPGETTGSFLSATAPDFGCRAFKSGAPLHVAYSGTQLDDAVGFLLGHRDTRLVTIALGANDLFLLQYSCGGDPQCIQAGLQGVLTNASLNMGTILGKLRATGYNGPIVLVGYYSLDYTNPQDNLFSQSLNAAMASAGAAYGAIMADSFTEFQKAASTASAGGQTCKAGLLNVDPQNVGLCDVHPSQTGQRLLADGVADALRAGR